jgi:hypothetical protein
VREDGKEDRRHQAFCARRIFDLGNHLTLIRQLPFIL